MICENCGKEHDGSYGSGRFCSKFCANSFSRKNIDKSKTKLVKCIDCGNLFETKSTSLQRRCPKCKDIYIRSHYVRRCPICGQEHYKYDKCNNEFCKRHSYQQFKSLIKYFAFNKDKYGTLEVENEFNRIRNIIYDLYWKKHKSSAQICKIYNYPSVSNLTNKIFNYLEIPHKDCKYAVKENYIENRLNVGQESENYQYKHGWHTTWNNKKVYLRSSYEFDYAKHLDDHQIDYQVESLHIEYFDSQKQESRCAIPDFYIPSKNLIVEIKSNYTLDKQNMIDKKKAYIEQGYDFKLICDHKEINI